MMTMEQAERIICPHCDDLVNADTHDLEWCYERGMREAARYAEERAEDIAREERAGV